MRQSSLAFLASASVGVPFVVWDAFWLPFIPSRDQRQAVFIACYGLSRVEAPFGEPPVLTDLILFDDDGFWLSVLAFVISPGGSCPDGCSLCVPYPC